MTCAEVRELIGADPEQLPAEVQQHLQSCPACREYHAQMLALNAKLRRAFEFEVHPVGRTSFLESASPAGASNVIHLAERRAGARPTRKRGFSLSVGLAAGLLLAFTLWVGRPLPGLAAEVVQHVQGEPDSWSRTRAVSAAELTAVLRRSHVRLAPVAEPVVYASSCWFRGHYVPHFVIMTHSGPVTVMILVHQPVAAREMFHAEGYSGLLVPAGGGSIAVLSRHPMQLDEPADEMVRALQTQ